jgi:fructose-1,6-bisphosphatase/inositol monophosphatase family enzyme
MAGSGSASRSTEPVIPPLDWLIARAEAAGQAALGALPAMESELKPDETLVTNIDRMIEARLREEITREFPGHGFVGEEYGRDATDREFVWAIDPVDGTANMVHGLPQWAISVGLLRDGQPLAGVVHLPVLGETYAAVRGGGAALNGRPLRARDQEGLARDDTVGIGSEAIHLVNLCPFISRQRNFGAVAVHLAYAARGSLRGNVSGDDKLYDVAAGLLIAAEAGCRAEWLAGGEVKLSSWLDGTKPDDLMLVAPPRILATLRETFSPTG